VEIISEADILSATNLEKRAPPIRPSVPGRPCRIRRKCLGRAARRVRLSAVPLADARRQENCNEKLNIFPIMD